MENYLRNRKQRSWPLFLSVFLTVVYILSYLFNVLIPASNRIMLFRGEGESFWGLPLAINLPFNIHCWFDIPLIFLLSSLLLSYFKYLELDKNNKFRDSQHQLAVKFKLGLLFGLSFGLLFSLIPAPAVGLWFGIWFGLFVGFAASLFFEAWTDIGTSLGAGIGFGLMFNISFGIRLGLGLNLSLGMTSALIYSGVFALLFIILVSLKISIQKFLDFSFSDEPTEISFRRKKHSS